MKMILKQLAQLLAALLLLYLVLLAVTLLLVPRSELGTRLNTGRAGDSLFLTEPKYVFLARSQLDTKADKAILLGASNMLAGFRLQELQPLVPALEVHNLSVGGSNITQIDQVVDLIGEVQTEEARRHNTYVIGLWYGIFAADRTRWYTPDRHGGDTDIDIERYRYGFYRRTDSGPVPVLPPRHLGIGVILIHPYLVLDRTARDISKKLRDMLSARKPSTTDDTRNAVVLSAGQQQGYLGFWRDYMGDVDSFEDAPFQVLDSMVAKIRAQGGRVVLVDLPIPRWHSSGSLLWADYRRHIDPLLERLKGQPGVSLLQMGDADADADFSDEVHPKPRVTSLWAKRLATVLNARPS